MSMFPAISIAGTGLEVDQTWIDAIGGNVANAEDAVTPGQPVYRDEEIVAGIRHHPPGRARSGNGVERQGHRARLRPRASSPMTRANPIANKEGYVAYPDVNIGHEMTSLVEAQVSYEVDSKVLQNSTDAYNAILQIKP